MWFTRVSINNPVFATMVMVALCVLGLFSYNQLGVERMPDITPPIVFVSVAYPGASAEASVRYSGRMPRLRGRPGATLASAAGRDRYWPSASSRPPSCCSGTKFMPGEPMKWPTKAWLGR